MTDRPSIEVLREVIRYVPETGKLFWLERPRKYFSSDFFWRRWSVQFAGKEAMARGRGCILQFKNIQAHHVAWALYHGKWPTECIGHKNGDKLDNRISNLYEETAAEFARVVGERSHERSLARRQKNKKRLGRINYENATAWQGDGEYDDILAEFGL